MTIVEIPLANKPQTFLCAIGGKQYKFTLTWANADEGGWIMDIDDNDGSPILRGAPLVTGIDLLLQYPHLNIGGKLFIFTAGESGAPPTFDNLGNESRLYFSAGA